MCVNPRCRYYNSIHEGMCNLMAGESMYAGAGTMKFVHADGTTMETNRAFGESHLEMFAAKGWTPLKPITTPEEAIKHAYRTVRGAEYPGVADGIPTTPEAPEYIHGNDDPIVHLAPIDIGPGRQVLLEFHESGKVTWL